MSALTSDPVALVGVGYTLRDIRRGNKRCFTMKAFVFALLLAVPLDALSGPRTIVWDSSAQNITYNRGKATVWVHGSAVSIGATFEESDRKTGQIDFLIKHRGLVPITVIADDLRVTTSDGKELHVWSKAEIVKKIEKYRFWTELAQAAAGAGNSYGAASSGYRQESGSVSGYVDGKYVSGTYSARVRDDAARDSAIAEADRENAEAMEKVDEFFDERVESVEATAWSNHTIEPGHDFFSSAVFDLPKKTRSSIDLVIALRVGDDYFEANAKLDP